MTTQTWETNTDFDAGTFNSTHTASGFIVLDEKNSRTVDAGVWVDGSYKEYETIGVAIDHLWVGTSSGADDIYNWSGGSYGVADGEPSEVHTFTFDALQSSVIYFEMKITVDASYSNTSKYGEAWLDVDGGTVVNPYVYLSDTAGPESDTDTGSKEYHYYVESASYDSETRTYTEGQTFEKVDITTSPHNGDITFTFTDAGGNTVTQTIGDNGTTTVDITGLDPGTEISWDASFNNTNDGQQQDIDALTITSHTAPYNLTVDDTRTTEIDLSWDGESDEYYIYRAESSGSTTADYTQIATVASEGVTTTYTDTGLEQGEEYFYRVSGSDGQGGETELTSEVNTITVLLGPTSFTLDASVENEISLDWTRNDNSIDGNWEIYRSEDGSLGSVIQTFTDLTKTSYTDTSVLDGEEYYYTVRRNTDHVTKDTAQKSKTTVFPPPSDLLVESIDGDQFTISWTDNADNENGYRVYVSRDQGGTWTNDSGDLPANTEQYQTSALLDGEEYRIAVEAFTEHTTATNDPKL